MIMNILLSWFKKPQKITVVRIDLNGRVVNASADHLTKLKASK